jgi:hypothetical protein
MQRTVLIVAGLALFAVVALGWLVGSLAGGGSGDSAVLPALNAIGTDASPVATPSWPGAASPVPPTSSDPLTTPVTAGATEVARAMPTAAPPPIVTTVSAATPASAPAATGGSDPTDTSALPATPVQGSSGLAIFTVSDEGNPLPGACYSVAIGLRGAELLPALEEVDLSPLRAGVVVDELCDDGDGHTDGVLTVGGAVADVARDVASALAGPDQAPELVRLFERLTVTLNLVQVQTPEAGGSVPSSEPLPQMTFPLADLGDGARVRVVYWPPSGTPIPLGLNGSPASSDGTGIVD